VSVVEAARRLVEHKAGYPVISVYVDLDPERFATARARASQVRSLLDGAAREVEGDNTLDHDARTALREDLERVRSYLLSREPPYKGARALAVFCSSRAGLFEVVQLTRPVDARVVIDRHAYVQPLVEAAHEERWCVVLVTRREARILTGPPDRLQEQHRIKDDVPGQHDQGGWSQANYERSIENDADAHLRRVADVVGRDWQRERFERFALGGPQEVVPRFEALLRDEVRARIVDGRVELDVGTATEDQVRAAVSKLVEADEQRREREALDRLAAGLGTRERAAGGPDATLEALNERRVEKLLLDPGFDRRGGRCPRCGLLALAPGGRCPADGTELEEVEHLREAVVEAAIAQDADVLVIRRYPDLGPFQGIAALLRF
jgi:peptide chain release factor subunit 1